MSEVKPLMEMLEKLVEDKTFSLEAIKRVEDLKTQVKDLSDRNEVLNREKGRLETLNNQYREEIVTLKNRVSNIQEELNAKIQYCKELDNRHFNLSVGERVLELTDKRREDIFRLVELVFKNTTVRESLHKSEQVPVAVQGSNGCGGYVSRETKDVHENKTIVTE